MTLPEANAGDSILWQFLGRRLPQSSILALFSVVYSSRLWVLGSRNVRLERYWLLQFPRIPVHFDLPGRESVSVCCCESIEPGVVRITNDC